MAFAARPAASACQSGLPTPLGSSARSAAAGAAASSGSRATGVAHSAATCSADSPDAARAAGSEPRPRSARTASASCSCVWSAFAELIDDLTVACSGVWPPPSRSPSSAASVCSNSSLSAAQ